MTFKKKHTVSHSRCTVAAQIIHRLRRDALDEQHSQVTHRLHPQSRCRSSCADRFRPATPQPDIRSKSFPSPSQSPARTRRSPQRGRPAREARLGRAGPAALARPCHAPPAGRTRRRRRRRSRPRTRRAAHPARLEESSEKASEKVRRDGPASARAALSRSVFDVGGGGSIKLLRLDACPGLESGRVGGRAPLPDRNLSPYHRRIINTLITPNTNMQLTKCNGN